MNEHPLSESAGNSTDPFEQLLQACKPAGGNQLVQMLYQAGWHAAMAQINHDVQIEKEADRLSTPVSTLPADKHKSRRSGKWFGAGLATGVAVTLPCVFLALTAFNWDQHSITMVQKKNQSENRSKFETDDPSGISAAQLPPDNENRDPGLLTRSKRGISSLGWSHWLGSSSDLGFEMVTHKNHADSSDIEWDALPASYQRHRRLWRESERYKSNDQPQAIEKWRPLTEAKIRELL